MLVIVSLMIAHALANLPIQEWVGEAAKGVRPSGEARQATTVRVSLPPSLREAPARISLPNEALGVVPAAPVEGAEEAGIAGAIEVPSNARGPRAPRSGLVAGQGALIAGDDEDGADGYTIHGSHGVRRRAWPIHGASGALKQVGGWGVSRDGASGDEGSFPYDPGSILNESADEAHRRAQLRFHEASYPRLDTFEEAHRRAQLEFHRSTLTPGGRRGADGLRRDREGLRGPELRRETRGGRRW